MYLGRFGSFCSVMTVDEAKEIMREHGCPAVSEHQIPHGVQLRGGGGQIVNVFDKGTYSLQGRKDDGLTEKFSVASSTAAHGSSTAATPPADVFVVYGHNEEVKQETELMLRKWGLEPILLDQIPLEGLTLIEKLEKYIRKSPFAVVLATADDVCLSGAHDDDKTEFRARQNVVLELGMLLALLGRPNVAILLEKRENMKKPSDIEGLEYLPFETRVSDVRIGLAQMMNRQGYAINLNKL